MPLPHDVLQELYSDQPLQYPHSFPIGLLHLLHYRTNGYVNICGSFLGAMARDQLINDFIRDLVINILILVAAP